MTANSLGIFEWLLVAGIQHSSIPVAKKSVSLLETVLAQTPDVNFLGSIQTQ